MAKQGTGFTLLELMVVIIIIAILVAVSGPVYTSYTIKARFGEVVGIINQYHDDLQSSYNDNGLFPSTFDNGNITAATYNSLSSDVLQQVYYAIGSNGQSAYLQFFTSNLGISGYVEANNSGSGGVSCRVTLAAVANSTGQMEYYCGQWDGSSTDVPLIYLPASCQDTNISALIL